MSRFFLVLLFALTVSTARADVVFDPQTGTGSIDAGTVATMTGWDAASLDRGADGIGFVLAEEARTIGACDAVRTMITDRTDHILDVIVTRNADGSLGGFQFAGLGRAVGQPAGHAFACVPGAVWTVEATPATGYSLFAVYKGEQVLVWPGTTPGILREPQDDAGPPPA